MNASSLLFSGTLVGLGAAAPIGPVNVEMARRALRGGFSAGAALGCGAVMIDVLYCTANALGLSRLARMPIAAAILAPIGVVLLAWLGWMSFRNGRLTIRHPLTRVEPGAAAKGGFVTGLLMTLTNPMTLAFWFTAVPALAGPATERETRDLPIIALGVCLGAGAWVICFCLTLAAAGRHCRGWWLAAADELGGSLLLLLAGAAWLRWLRTWG